MSGSAPTDRIVPPGPNEPVVTGLVRLERRVLSVWRIRALVSVLLAAVAVGSWVGAAVALVDGDAVAGVGPGVAVATCLGVVGAGLALWWTALVWRGWQFRVGERALQLRHGVVVVRQSTIPYHRVQHIDIEAGPLERRFGLATLVLRTASASSDSTVPGIDAAAADVLRRRILALVGTGDAV